MVAIGVVTAIELIAIGSSFMQLHLLNQVAAGIEVSEQAADANDTRERVLGLIFLAAYLASTVIYILWFYRAYYNLGQKTATRFSTGWAAGAWFIPFLNLVRPYQIMQELYEKTREVLTAQNPEASIILSHSMVGWWWALWILSNILGQFVYRYTMKAKSIDELITATVASIISNLVAIPLGIIAISVIRDYARVESQLAPAET